MHEVVEVTKLLGSLYLCGCFLRERCDACNLQHHGTEPFLPICVGNWILKWNNMCLPGELRYRSFSNRFCADMFDNDAHPKCQTHELCSQFGSPG